jgi:hypothetical protein
MTVGLELRCRPELFRRRSAAVFCGLKIAKWSDPGCSPKCHAAPAYLSTKLCSQSMAERPRAERLATSASWCCLCSSMVARCKFESCVPQSGLNVESGWVLGSREEVVTKSYRGVDVVDLNRV